MRMLLEVIVQSVADAREAAAGGADRLEVVREIERDGLTPSIDLVRAIQAETVLPLRVMVRESDGFTIAGPDELAVLQRAFESVAALGVDGAVVGFARDGMLDLETLQAVIDVAPALPVTLHRAFDSVRDPLAAIDSVRAVSQIDRILTSGGSGDSIERCRRLEEYARRAGMAVTILAGGGVDAETLRTLAAQARVREAHVGRAAREPQLPTAAVSRERVRVLRSIADTSPPPPH